MIGHQAVGMSDHGESAKCQDEYGKKSAPGNVFKKNARLSVATGDHLAVGRPPRFYAKWPGDGRCSGIIQDSRSDPYLFGRVIRLAAPCQQKASGPPILVDALIDGDEQA